MDALVNRLRNMVSPRSRVAPESEPDNEPDYDSDAEGTQPDLNPDYQVNSHLGLAALEEQMLINNRQEREQPNVRQNNELRNLEIGMNRDGRGAFVGFGLNNAF